MVPLTVVAAPEMENHIILFSLTGLEPKPEGIVVGLSQTCQSELIDVFVEAAVSLKSSEEVEFSA